MRSTARSALSLAFTAIGLIAGCGDDDGNNSNNNNSNDNTASDSEATGSDSGSDSTSDSDSATDSDSGDTDEGPWDALDERPCPSDSFLTYENLGGPFINSNCTGCHHSELGTGERQGAPLSIDFETIALIRAQAERIWARSGDQNSTMPPSGPADAGERTLLGEWLACGAPTAADLAD